MAKVALICVNYNSDESVFRYIKSVVIAKENVESQFALSIIVVDNSDRANKDDFFVQLQSISDNVQMVKSPGNVGYFGGIRCGIAVLNDSLSQFDYLIVSNVDLQLRDNFFCKLLHVKNRKHCGVIAPSVFSSHRKKDLNPKIMNRPTRWRMKLYTKIFSKPNVFVVYEKIAQYKYKILHALNRIGTDVENRAKNGMRIYAPHGAIIIFTKEYFQRGGNFDYPMFLFGEEVFVAEIVRCLNLQVLYQPSLVVYDDEHVATGKMNRKTISRFYAVSAVYLYKTFFAKGVVVDNIDQLKQTDGRR